MRLRDLQEVFEKFTKGQKGSIISDAHVYIETHDGHLEDIRRIELQENSVIGSAEPCRLVFKPETMKLFRSKTFRQS
tara:strand:- start:153 stop:383 length:231 start_codon:yes stop_codon:yes gene_type:complete